MRLCYLADAPYIHTRRWVQHFVARGWDIHVVSFRPAQIEGAAVHHVDGWARLGKARYLLHARRLRRMVSDLSPDILHALHLTSYGFLAALCDVRPTIASVWGTDVLEAPRLSPFHYFITRFALRRADRITATGLRLAEATARYAPRGKPITVIPYGVDLQKFRPRVRRADIPLGPPVVGAVARLSKEKGLHHLLRAAAQLRTSGLDLRVVLAGDGPQRRRLERLGQRLGLADRLTFLGDVPHEQVPDIFATFDVFAMPSTYEGFGVAALEAQAVGVPVVASNVHGIPDAVADGETGLLVPPRDERALAEAIGRLLADEPLRRQMGEAGRAFVAQNYSWEENTRQMEELYASVLAGG